MTQGKLEDAIAAEKFLRGGKATLTLQSEATGARYTFKVAAKKDAEPPVTFVSLLAGPDNESDYVYIGILNGYQLRLTAKSRMNDDSAPVKAFRYMLAGLSRGVISPQLAFYHEGRCCRCNRLLTVPDSIASGIGPECAAKMGM